MIILSMPRASGKTYKLIEASATSGCYILVADRIRASQLAEQAQKLGFNIPYPLTIADVRHTSSASSVARDGIYIDELPDVLERLLGVKVNAATLTPTMYAEDLLKRQSHGQAFDKHEWEARRVKELEKESQLMKMLAEVNANASDSFQVHVLGKFDEEEE